MPLDAARQLADFVRHVLDNGYDPVDLAPYNNVLIDSTGEMRLIDFEFVYSPEVPPSSPELSFCLAGVPEWFDGDLPVHAPHFRNPYPTHWYPFIGLSATSLLHDPRWLQLAKRSVNYSIYLLMRALRADIRSERLGIPILVRGARHSLTQVLRWILGVGLKPQPKRIRPWTSMLLGAKRRAQ